MLPAHAAASVPIAPLRCRAFTRDSLIYADFRSVML